MKSCKHQLCEKWWWRGWNPLHITNIHIMSSLFIIIGALCLLLLLHDSVSFYDFLEVWFWNLLLIWKETWLVGCRNILWLVTELLTVFLSVLLHVISPQKLCEASLTPADSCCYCLREEIKLIKSFQWNQSNWLQTETQSHQHVVKRPAAIMSNQNHNWLHSVNFPSFSEVTFVKTCRVVCFTLKCFRRLVIGSIVNTPWTSNTQLH